MLPAFCIPQRKMPPFFFPLGKAAFRHYRNQHIPQEALLFRTA